MPHNPLQMQRNPFHPHAKQAVLTKRNNKDETSISPHVLANPIHTASRWIHSIMHAAKGWRHPQSSRNRSNYVNHCHHYWIVTVSWHPKRESVQMNRGGALLSIHCEQNHTTISTYQIPESPLLPKCNCETTPAQGSHRISSSILQPNDIVLESTANSQSTYSSPTITIRKRSQYRIVKSTKKAPLHHHIPNNPKQTLIKETQNNQQSS